MSEEAGKPIKTSRVEVDRAIFTFAVAAEEATRIGGEWLPLDWQASTAGRAGIVRRFPLGPIFAITPFNFPLNLVAHKVAPAIAAGCTIVLKPAPQTPFCSLLLAEVVEQMPGCPLAHSTCCHSRMPIAERLVSDDRLKMLTFTGSANSGLGAQAKGGKEESNARTGRQRRRHRSFRCRCAVRCGALRGWRIFVYRADVHFGPAHLRASQRSRKIPAALLAGVKKLKIGNPLGRIYRRRSS